MMCPENPLEFARYDDRQFLCQRALQGTPPIALSLLKTEGAVSSYNPARFIFLSQKLEFRLRHSLHPVSYLGLTS
jgi:hypothetical protein